jgi:hypothetical protein
MPKAKAVKKTVAKVKAILSEINDDLISACRKRWKALYGSAVSSDYTVECCRCDKTVYGDKPSIVIECLDCFAKDMNIKVRELRRHQKAHPDQ